jgi:hypothetical protein
MSKTTFQDDVRECVECGAPFTWTASEQQFFASRDLHPPRRCQDCRKARRQTRPPWAHFLGDVEARGRAHFTEDDMMRGQPQGSPVGDRAIAIAKGLRSIGSLGFAGQECMTCERAGVPAARLGYFAGKFVYRCAPCVTAGRKAVQRATAPAARTTAPQFNADSWARLAEAQRDKPRVSAPSGPRHIPKEPAPTRKSAPRAFWTRDIAGIMRQPDAQ